MAIELSVDQQKIAQWALDHLGTRRSLIVNAGPGVGKTHTSAGVMEALLTSNPGLKVAYLAFGRRNVRDMLKRMRGVELPRGAEAQIKTQHSLGYSLLHGHRVNKLRTHEFIKDLHLPSGNWNYGLSKLVEVAQNAGVMVPDEHGNSWWPTPYEWEDLAIDFDVDNMIPVKRPTPATWRMIDGWMAKLLLAHSQYGHGVTHGDQVWMPLVRPDLRKNIPVYDALIIDEFQDTNIPRRIFANCCAGPTTIRIWVGDSRQAIFAFSGADTKAFTSVRATQLCPVDTLELDESYRLTQESSAWVSKIWPGVRSWSGAAVGTPPKVVKFENIKPEIGDVILARTNRAVVDLFFRFMNRGVNVRIERDEFAKKMDNLHGRLTKRKITAGMSLTDYKRYVIEQAQEQIDEYKKADRVWKALRVADEYSSFLRIIDFALRAPAEILDATLGANRHPFETSTPDWTTRDLETVTKVVSHILTASSDDDESRESMVTVATGHSFKGLEANNVYWYAFDTLHPSKWARTAEEKLQDKNLEYVMRSRSKGANYLVPEVVDYPVDIRVENDDDEEDS